MVTIKIEDDEVATLDRVLRQAKSENLPEALALVKLVNSINKNLKKNVELKDNPPVN